jgi:hypothetical protein
MKKTLIFLGVFGVVAWLFPQILSFLFTLLILIIILAVWGAFELGTGGAGFESKSTYTPPQEPQSRKKSRVDEMVEDYQNKKAFDSMYHGRDEEN